MYLNFAIATMVLGSMFSINAFAAESESVDDKKRRHHKPATLNHFEPVVDIHNSAVIVAHPTPLLSGKEGIAELQKLNEIGAAREQSLRAWHESRGTSMPVRFAGD
jgi:hypothetical protein